MQNSSSNNDDNYIKNSQQFNSVSHSIPNNSIRFAFPERPLQQDYSNIRPYRTATFNSIQSSRYHTPHRKHHYDHSFWRNLPFFMGSVFSVVGTFLCVRALVVYGYLVDHTFWDGKGHYYDCRPVVFLNTVEILMMMTSLLCGLCVCTLVVLKTRIHRTSVSSFCLIGALIQGSCSLTTTFSFYGRTLELVETLENYVYSRGFYSCVISGVLMLLAMLGFFLDWLLDSPSNGPLFVVLNAMLLPSVMYCCILSVGTLTFMWIEDWEYSQAMMFCATALTTIGYGDVAPVTPLGRLVFLVYAAFGIGVVGYFLLSLRAVMINGSSFNLMMKVNLVRVESLHDFARHQRQRDRQRYRSDQHWERLQYEQDHDIDFTRNEPSLPMFSPMNDDGDDDENNNNDDDDELPIAATATTSYDPPPPPRRHRLSRHRSTDVISTFSNYTLANIFNEENRQMWVHVITHSGVWRMSVIFALSWFGGALVFCLLEEHWSYLDALYFAFATQLTIGFGDLVPQTTIAQEFWFVYIIISIAVAAYFICLFGDVLAEKLLIDDKNDCDSHVDDDHDDDRFNRYHGTGEMVEDNDLTRNDRGFDSNSNTTTAKKFLSESYCNSHHQNTSTSTWASPNMRQDITSTAPFPRHHRQSNNTASAQQDQLVHHQPLQHRTNSLPILSIDQKRHTYGTLPQSSWNVFTHNNKKNNPKIKSSKYLPVAVTSNTHFYH